MELLKNTLYINLEHRTDRLEHVTKQLASIGVTGERFNAFKTNVGAIGCTLSHIKCLELAKARDYEQVFICEDDITFLDPGVFMSSLEKFAANRELDWDVLIIGGNIVPPYEPIQQYSPGTQEKYNSFSSRNPVTEKGKELEFPEGAGGGKGEPGVPPKPIDNYCVRVGECQTTTGYIVRRQYYDVLIDNFRDSVKNLIQEPDNKPMYALDIYWKRLQKSGRWYMIFPLTVVQYDTYSDIEGRYTDYRGLMLDKDKKWLVR